MLITAWLVITLAGQFWEFIGATLFQLLPFLQQTYSTLWLLELANLFSVTAAILQTVCLTSQWMSVGYFGLLLLSDPSMPHCSPLLSSAQILMPHRSLCMGRWGGELSCLLFFFLPCVHGFWVRHLVTLSVFIWRFREISKTMLLLPSSKLILCYYILTPSMFMWGEGNDISILEKR